MTLLHCIFQRQGITFDDFYSRTAFDRAFMLASMQIELENEAKRREGVEDGS